MPRGGHGLVRGAASKPQAGHGRAQHLDHADTWPAPRAAAFLRSLPPTAVLHQELARDAEFCVEIIDTISSPEHDEDGQERQITDEQRQRATLSYQLLRSWHTIPGSLSPPEAPAGPSLGEWVTVARALLTERKLLRSGDQFIGQILSQIPEDPDGTWPGL